MTSLKCTGTRSGNEYCTTLSLTRKWSPLSPRSIRSGRASNTFPKGQILEKLYERKNLNMDNDELRAVDEKRVDVHTLSATWQSSKRSAARWPLCTRCVRS